MPVVTSCVITAEPVKSDMATLNKVYRLFQSRILKADYIIKQLSRSASYYPINDSLFGLTEDQKHVSCHASDLPTTTEQFKNYIIGIRIRIVYW